MNTTLKPTTKAIPVVIAELRAMSVETVPPEAHRQGRLAGAPAQIGGVCGHEREDAGRQERHQPREKRERNRRTR